MLGIRRRHCHRCRYVAVPKAPKYFPRAIRIGRAAVKRFYSFHSNKQIRVIKLASARRNHMIAIRIMDQEQFTVEHEKDYKLGWINF